MSWSGSSLPPTLGSMVFDRLTIAAPPLRHWLSLPAGVSLLGRDVNPFTYCRLMGSNSSLLFYSSCAQTPALGCRVIAALLATAGH